MSTKQSAAEWASVAAVVTAGVALSCVIIAWDALTAVCIAISEAQDIE